ncbi:hypothetical protein F5Y09DRAFT_346926 [Xylaria sp. FL1042]|nr:hypothetical protein F5Y09DRAFT_346926 [Xylaria sp. FL1042]
MSILEHHRDRLVPMNEQTQRIICIRNLACSSHFYATWESRQAATSLYPIRLPVSRMVDHLDTGCGILTVVNDHSETDVSRYPSEGAIYISTDLDIFVIRLERLLPNENYLTQSFDESPTLGGEKNFGWRTPGLSWPQCQRVRRIMLFTVGWPRLKREHHLTPNCIIQCGKIDHCLDTWHDSTVFPGVQTCFYGLLDYWEQNSHAIYLSVLNISGHSVLETLEQENQLAYFDAEDIEKHREQGNSEECVCGTTQVVDVIRYIGDTAEYTY